MYISNSNNIGMATLLQQNKSCVKTLSNGNNSGNIVVGNVSTTPTQVTTANGIGSNNVTSSGSIVLPVPAPGTTILLTNGATGASSIITYQQYQQLLQQQQSQQVQNSGTVPASSTRLIVPQELVSVPVANIVSSSGNTPTTNQSTVFVATNANQKTINTSNSSGLSFQQQFQQQVVSSGINTLGLQSRVITPTANGVLQQQSQNQTNTTTTTTSTRYFAQFSQSQQLQQHQQPAAISIPNGSRTILISRHQATPLTRQQNTTILSKSIVTTNPQNQVIRSQSLIKTATHNGPAIVKTQPKPTEMKVKQKSDVVESEVQKTTPQQHRYGMSTIQQIKMQQLRNEEEEREANAANGNALKKDSLAIKSDTKEEESFDPEPEIDIVINNVVCSFSVRCHLNLREIALKGSNVEYRRENGMVTMKLRRPYTTASIWSSGRITCTGATSEVQAKIAARRYARCLEKLGFRVRFHNFRVVNVLGTCSMPWAIKIVNFSEKYKKEASYEPELHPGVTYKLRYPKATLKIFSTGSITVTAASVANVQTAIEHIYPLVYEFRKKRSPQEVEQLRLKQQAAGLHNGPEIIDPDNLPDLIEYIPADAEEDDIVLPITSTTPTIPIAGSKVMRTTIRKFSSNLHPVSSNIPNHKRRRLNSSSRDQDSIFEDEYDADDPEEAIEETVESILDDLIEYSEVDEADELIEGDAIQV